MKKSLATILFLLVTVAATSQQNFPLTPEERLLDNFVGKWKIAGIIHGHPYTLKMHAEWVLGHQFLQINEKSDQNIFGEDFPFEGMYYFRYDYSKKQYFSHLLKNYGSDECENLGRSDIKDNQLTFVYKLPHEQVSEQFTWLTASKSWVFKSWGDPPDGKRIDIVDVRITKVD